MKTLLSRRETLKLGAATIAAASVHSPAADAQGNRPPLIDTHLHCFAGAANARFPYHDRAPYRPAEPATPERLLKCMNEAGVAHAIVVHPEPYQDDHRYLEHCLEIGRGKLKGTLLVFADREGSLEKLPALCQKLDVVAARIHAHSADRLPPFGKPELRRLWQLATDHGLAIQLHFQPRYALGFEPLIREFAQTKVIIDHMGRPYQGTPEEHAKIVRWSRYENTIMKLSSLPETAPDPSRELPAVVRQLTDAWGAERMIFGDSFGPETTGETYRAAFHRARGLVAHLSEEDQNKVLGGTASRLFNFRV
jgi:predicted TIM-barrel fold metal-dependent hydrolase